MASLGAFLTGLYGFRLLFRVFLGPASPFVEKTAPAHTAHGEGPRSMLVPVYILTALTIVGGILQFPGVTHLMSSFLEPTVYGAEEMLEPTTSEEWLTTLLAMGAGLAGALIAYRLWGKGRTEPVSVSPALRRSAERRLYWDDLYDAVFYRPAAALSRALWVGARAPVLHRFTGWARLRHHGRRAGGRVPSRPASSGSTHSPSRPVRRS